MSFDDINDANFDKVRYQALKASAGSGKTFNLAARFLARRRALKTPLA